ncbi:MAG: enoyl-CoA hydratase [Corynebacterium nuruki]|nr:enoyl-CoA hydratase [Corynebacterium nuruki]
MAETAGAPVSLEIDGQVAIVTLTRPDRRNALDADVCRALTAALQDAAAAATAGAAGAARAVLLRGEGPAFCAGANLKGGVYADDFFEALGTMLATVTELPLPVIADIQGPAVGAGCQLALACDLRVMGPKARVWVPAVQHGFALDPWTVARAVELLGGSVARNVLIAGAQVGQQAAVTSGFAMLGGDAADALEMARVIAGQAPLPTAYFKRALNNQDPDELTASSLEAQAAACWASEDVQEARRARAERRTPVFGGR